MDDFARHPEWQNGVVSVQILTEGPVQVGTEVEEVRKLGGREDPLRWRITEHDPPRRSAFASVEGQQVKLAGVTVVTPAGTGCEVTFEMDVDLKGAGKLLSPLISRDLKKSVPADLERLKQRLEG